VPHCVPIGRIKDILLLLVRRASLLGVYKKFRSSHFEKLAKFSFASLVMYVGMYEELLSTGTIAIASLPGSRLHQMSRRPRNCAGSDLIVLYL
jgi:hypothetical protein